MTKKTASSQPAPRPFVYRNRTLHCDEVSLDPLAEKYGTPLYVYSATQISQRFQLFDAGLRAWSQRPPPHHLLRRQSQLLPRHHPPSGRAGSRLRHRLRRRTRARPQGPQARPQKSSLLRRRQTTLGDRRRPPRQHPPLQRRVRSRTPPARRPRRSPRQVARFALRVNPDVFAETHPYISTGLSEHKFGIDIKAARAIYRAAKKSKWLDPAGVSVHIGSQIRKVDPFAAALTRVTSLIADLRKDGHNIRYVDAGGGLGIDYGTHRHFDPAKQVEKYAAALTKGLANERAHLLLEPGRFIVAQAGALLTRVLYVKKNGAKTFVITDAGMNDLIRPALYHAHHEIIPVKQPAGKSSLIADVVGPVCESGDFFARDRTLSPVKPNDLVALLDAGAYGMSQTSNYNTRPRPAEVLINGDSTKLIRRRETMRDLLAPELL